MTPDEYEHLVASVLRREGWDTTVTPSVRDMGLDVVAERGGVRLGVQAKMYRAANRPVNAEVVMLTYGACAYADCTACMIVTDGRVLKDAERVAAKLHVEIRTIPAAAPANDDAAGPREGAVDRQSFGRIWSEDVTALAGRTLHRANGRSNHILAVDTAGVVRRTSNGKTQRIDIEVFRWAIDRLLSGEAVLREDINAHCLGRASSGVMLVLSELPMFEPITQGRKQGLRMRPPSGAPPGSDLEASGGPGRDGLCAILQAAGHEVITKGIVAALPRLDALSGSAGAEVLAVYRKLGGQLESPALRPGPWDLTVDGILVEFDEQLHFNRYRAITLEAPTYAMLSRFPLTAYRAFSAAKEPDCLRLGSGQGRWMNTSTEAHFGPSGPRGDLSGNGSSRWKQRALYDFMKDLTQLDPAAPPLARITIWDPLPGVPGVTVEKAVHQHPDERVAGALRILISERSGQRL